MGGAKKEGKAKAWWSHFFLSGDRHHHEATHQHTEAAIRSTTALANQTMRMCVWGCHQWLQCRRF